MTNEQTDNVEDIQLGANMILFGGAFDGQRLYVKYIDRKKKLLPANINIPVQTKVLTPAHIKPRHETYSLRKLSFSKQSNYLVYVVKGITMDDFFTMLLQGYNPEPTE